MYVCIYVYVYTCIRLDKLGFAERHRDCYMKPLALILRALALGDELIRKFESKSDRRKLVRPT